MRGMSRLGKSATAMTVMTASALTSALLPGAGTATAAAPIPINSDLRNCDFSLVATSQQVPRTTVGRGTADIRTSGSTVVADVHMTFSNQPGAHFDAGLIQVPRPSSATCDPGDPGTTYTSLDTDPSGTANVTITAPIRQGTTGVFILVKTPQPHNQTPGEFYTTEYLAPV
jgi:hypothetical protein